MLDPRGELAVAHRRRSSGKPLNRSAGIHESPGDQPIDPAERSFAAFPSPRISGGTDARGPSASMMWRNASQGEVMLGEITVIPQIEGPARTVVTEAVDEIAAQGLRYEVGATGTAVEGEMETILAAVRAVHDRLRADGIGRAVIELRLQLEPHPETLEHQVEGIGLSQA